MKKGPSLDDSTGNSRFDALGRMNTASKRRALMMMITGRCCNRLVQQSCSTHNQDPHQLAHICSRYTTSSGRRCRLINYRKRIGGFALIVCHRCVPPAQCGVSVAPLISNCLTLLSPVTFWRRYLQCGNTAKLQLTNHAPMFPGNAFPLCVGWYQV